MIGGIISSFTTFIALRTNALQSIGNWLTGNFAIITSGRYEVLYLTIPFTYSIAFVLQIILQLQVWGKDFSHNLGVSYEKSLTSHYLLLQR